MNCGVPRNKMCMVPSPVTGVQTVLNLCYYQPYQRSSSAWLLGKVSFNTWDDNQRSMRDPSQQEQVTKIQKECLSTLPSNTHQLGQGKAKRLEVLPDSSDPTWSWSVLPWIPSMVTQPKGMSHQQTFGGLSLRVSSLPF